jgi:hypothetical protein
MIAERYGSFVWFDCARSRAQVASIRIDAPIAFVDRLQRVRYAFEFTQTNLLLWENGSPPHG